MGEQPSADDDFDVAGAGLAMAAAVLDALKRDPAIVLDVMRKLSRLAEGVLLVEAVLREGWEQVRDALASLGALGPLGDGTASGRLWPHPDGGDVGIAVYALLSLAPDGAPQVRTQQQLDFLVRAARYDPRFLRHVLTWAAAQPSGNAARWRVKGQPIPATMHRFAAQAVWWASAGRARRWEHTDWASPDALSLACTVIEQVDLEDLMEYSGQFLRSLEQVVAFGELDSGLAARAAADPWLLFSAFPKVELDAYNDELVARVLPWLPVTLAGDDALKAGWAIALELHSRGMARTPESVAVVLDTSSEAVESTLLCGVALLWADLKQLSAYSWQQQAQRRGVLARLSQHFHRWPEAWALSARRLLVQAAKHGTDVIDLLALAAVQHDIVRTELERIAARDGESEVRDHAQGILARLGGGLEPSEELSRWLADQAARAFDGIPMFPHPLTPLAKTWLGAIDLEDTLARSLRRAADRFRLSAVDQGAAVEELVTGRLLGELETAFRDSELLLTAGGRSSLKGVVTVRHRPITKQEEQSWGCDIALLLDADIPSVVGVRLAELVQVKKSQAFTAKRTSRPREAWRIDVPQLRQLLTRSQSSGYWLIASTGEILCVTARWLHALGRGRDALTQRSFTVGINDVRHHAIPIEQFLAELLLGTWLGTQDEHALRFARGEDGTIVPRHIFQITVLPNGEQRR
jgi:hypothetical protein